MPWMDAFTGNLGACLARVGRSRWFPEASGDARRMTAGADTVRNANIESPRCR